MKHTQSPEIKLPCLVSPCLTMVAKILQMFNPYTLTYVNIVIIEANPSAKKEFWRMSQCLFAHKKNFSRLAVSLVNECSEVKS